MITHSNFRPTLFVGIGETTALFTLRETYLHETWSKDSMGRASVDYSVRSFHHKNLSQSKDDALRKAMISSQELNLPLSTDAERMALKIDMRKIGRRTDAEIAEDERQARIALSIRHIKTSDEYDYRLMSRLTAKGNKWLIGFGKYAHMTYQDAIALDPSYFEWILKQNEEGDSEYYNDTQSAMIELFLERTEPAVDSEYFGEVGKRTNDIVATVTFLKDFDSQWGVSTLCLMKTEAGEELAIFTTSDLPEIGTKIKFNAMIKAHELYNDTKQTKLSRITKMEEL